jgi:F0F1-type ATP synthase membrane subunit b/b'
MGGVSKKVPAVQYCTRGIKGGGMELPAPLLFFGTLAILTVLELIALYMIYSYFKLLKSYDSTMRKQRDLEASVRLRSDELLKAAAAQAQTIIDQANTKAQTVVQQADFFNQVTQDKINDALEHVIQEELAVYQRLFEGIREETLKQLQTMREGISTQAGEQMGEASKAFSLAMADAQKRAQGQLETAYQKAQEDVAAYKTQRVKQLNQLTTGFVQEAAKRFFKKALTREQQETLVMEAMDEASREKLF